MGSSRSACDSASIGLLNSYSGGRRVGLASRRMPLSAGVKSAFSNYVRSGCRGEPDGRTAVVNDTRGRESDAAFTPSPVDPVHRTGTALRLISFEECIEIMRILRVMQVGRFGPFS